jgi:putative SOS response-associated peptidase YedK
MYLDSVKKKSSHGGKRQGAGRPRTLHGCQDPEEDHAKWLGETEDGDLKALLKPFPADQMRIWPISPRVNSPRNDDPDIVTPIAI